MLSPGVRSVFPGCLSTLPALPLSAGTLALVFSLYFGHEDSTKMSFLIFGGPYPVEPWLDWERVAIRIYCVTLVPLGEAGP